MAFEEDIPQLHMGPLHWLVAISMLALLGAIIWLQMVAFGVKARRASCLSRQKTIEDCVAVWENNHGKFPLGTIGYAAFTRKAGLVFESLGLPKEFTGPAISDCQGLAPWCCPEELFTDFQDDPAKVPDDHGRNGKGSYCFVQNDKKDTTVPLAEYVQSPSPLRMAICVVYGGKSQLGANGKTGTRHSDHW